MPTGDRSNPQITETQVRSRLESRLGPAMSTTFTNQPPIDFAQAENRGAMQEALATRPPAAGPALPAGHRRPRSRYRRAAANRPIRRTSAASSAPSPSPRGSMRATPSRAAKRGACRLGALAGRRAGRVPPQRGRRDARAAVRAGGLGSLSSAASSGAKRRPTSTRRSTSASSMPPRRSSCKPSRASMCRARRTASSTCRAASWA